MPRKSTTSRKPTRRSRWSPEQINEWRRRDREIRDRSTDYLEDAPGVRRFARNAATGGVSERILGYSIRNQMLLEKQAAELGFTLTDVATAKQWRQRGRRVKAEWYGQGLRLVQPKDRKKKDADPDAAEPEPQDVDADREHDEPADEQDTGEQDSGEQDAPKTRFRTIAVFDIAQTEPIPAAETPDCPLCSAGPGEPCRPGCTCAACADYLPADDPADVLWNNLVNQIDKAEYVMDWPAPAERLRGARVHVDHDERTVFVALDATAAAPDAVADLAAALAEIVARRDRAAEARRAQRKAARAITAAPSAA